MVIFHCFFVCLPEGNSQIWIKAILVWLPLSLFQSCDHFSRSVHPISGGRADGPDLEICLGFSRKNEAFPVVFPKSSRSQRFQDWTGFGKPKKGYMNSQLLKLNEPKNSRFVWKNGNHTIGWIGNSVSQQQLWNPAFSGNLDHTHIWGMKKNLDLLEPQRNMPKS